MKTVFLSFHFGDPDEKIASQVTTLLTSHGLSTITGEHLAGGGVSETVRRRIDKSDALIAVALADPNRQLGNGKFGTYIWVYDEISYARNKGKPVAVLAPGEVDLAAGMHADAERIAYDPQAPLGAFLKLSTTIGIWKSEAGRTVKLMLMSEEMANALGGDLDNGVCKYRILGAENADPGEWITTRLRGEVGGIVARADGLKDDDLIEVQVKADGAMWYSRGEPQAIKVEMRKKKQE